MILSFALLLAGTAAAAVPCAPLKSIKLPNVTISEAELVPAGPFRGDRNRAQQSQRKLPAHCRVFAVLAPSSDSHIEMELWMPAEPGWNGKYEAVGGGGWAGSVNFGAMITALQEGYATSSTDTGHKGNNGQFALGHPDKIVDFGYRAIHEITVASKKLVEAFYGRRARYSYFNGCSTGGRQGLMEAQRYPEDYDGIIAGAPANNHIHLHVAETARTIDIINIPGDHALTRAKQDFLNKSVLDSCDMLDGVKDRFLGNPRDCKFDPQTLLCKGSDSDTYLTAPQIVAVKRTYSDTKTKDGKVVWTGFELGSEAALGVIGEATEPLDWVLDTIRILGHQDPNWDWHQFDLDRDLALTIEKAGFINADNPDLSGFKAHGGKLLLFHGWNDQAIPPGNTINYYNSVLQSMGPNQGDWMRLFMIPGMQHCGGGPGPNQFNYMRTLEGWREAGRAPDLLVGWSVNNDRADMRLPVCAYPEKVPATPSLLKAKTFCPGVTKD